MRTLFPVAVVLLVLLALPGVAVFAADLMGYQAAVNAWLESALGVSHQVAVALPAAVVLFLVPPLIVLLYFLRLKRKPVPVSSTYLWKKSIEDLHVNRLMQWLRRNVLLLLQLLAILMLIYAALGPRLHGSLVGGKHYILLIDNSASMSATDVAPDRLSWAKEQALREIDAATDGDFGMVIVFNGTAEILQSYTNNREELRQAVRSVRPTQKPTRIDEALSLAASLANPQRSTEDAAAAPPNPEPGKERTYVAIEGLQADVHLYSDGRFPTPDFALANLNLTYHVPPAPAEGGTANNLAITRLEVEKGWLRPPPADDEDDPGSPYPNVTDADADDPTKRTAIVSVRNYRGTPVERLRVTLDVLEGDRLVRSYARTVRPAARDRQNRLGKAVYFYLPDVPEAADLTLHARLEGASDVFPLDDEAWAVLGVVRKAKVLVVTPDDNFLLRAFFDIPSSKKLAEVGYVTPAALADPAQYLTPAREGRYDLVLFDRCGPPSEDQMPAANTVFIGHPPPPFKPADKATGPNDPLAVKPVRFPSVQGSLDKHPVMANLRALYEMGIDESFRLPELPPGTQKLLEAAGGHVLIAGLPRGAFTDVVMCFPLLAADGRWNTRWALEPSFVLFLRNVLTTLGNVREATAEEPTLPGQEKPLRPGGAKTVRVRRPDGETKSFDRGPRPDFAYTDTDLVGVTRRVGGTRPGGSR
jgi:hypothetical protein